MLPAIWMMGNTEKQVTVDYGEIHTVEPAEYPVSLVCQRGKRKKRRERNQARKDKRETDEQRGKYMHPHLC